MTALLAEANPLNHVVQHTLPGAWFGLPDEGFQRFLHFPLISNHIIMQVVAALLVIIVLPWAVKKRAGGDEIGRLVPKGIGNAIEGLCQGLREQFFRPNLGEYTDRFTPYLWSTFFFIFTCNILGMIPLADWFSGEAFHHQIGGTPTGNLFVTAALALCSLVLIVYAGLRYHGMTYVKHFFLGPPGINVFIAILEVLGLGFKAMALAVRLFANMLAGHMLLAALLGFATGGFARSNTEGILITIPVILGSIAINFLEIFVAFLHAFIFTVLTAVFIGLSVNIHHGEHEHEEEHGHAAVVAAH